MAVATDTQCVVCGRTFAGRSKPVWWFDRDGLPLGRAHSGCRPFRGAYSDTNVSPTGAQFRVWVWHLAPRPAYDTDRWHAEMIPSRLDATEDLPSETLTPDQEDLLSWWTVDGPMQLGAHREAGIREAYAELVREFHAWHASLGEEE